jgi:hypothetical protein
VHFSLLFTLCLDKISKSYYLHCAPFRSRIILMQNRLREGHVMRLRLLPHLLALQNSKIDTFCCGFGNNNDAAPCGCGFARFATLPYGTQASIA